MAIKLKYKSIEEAESYVDAILKKNHIGFEYEKEIPYGKQYILSVGKTKCKIRIYSSKKGISIDVSPVKNVELNNEITELLSEQVLVSQIIKDVLGKSIIGSDESGKGDYFGPLCVASVFADEQTQEILKELSIKDSKKIKDDKIKEYARTIRETCVHSIVMIYPEKYNSLYDSFRNLNSLLSWAHAKALSNICEKTQCRDILIDRFSKTDDIEKYLIKNVGTVNVKSAIAAEENIVVAAASILARDAFCYGIERLEKKFSVELPKGANDRVEAKAVFFVDKYGRDELKKIAKLHFKTTAKTKASLIFQESLIHIIYGQIPALS